MNIQFSSQLPVAKLAQPKFGDKTGAPQEVLAQVQTEGTEPKANKKSVTYYLKAAWNAYAKFVDSLSGSPRDYLTPEGQAQMDRMDAVKAYHSGRMV